MFSFETVAIDKGDMDDVILLYGRWPPEEP